LGVQALGRLLLLHAPRARLQAAFREKLAGSEAA